MHVKFVLLLFVIPGNNGDPCYRCKPIAVCGDSSGILLCFHCLPRRCTDASLWCTSRSCGRGCKQPKPTMARVQDGRRRNWYRTVLRQILGCCSKLTSLPNQTKAELDLAIYLNVPAARTAF